MYERVSRETGVPLQKVKEYDKIMWDFIKVSLNNPTFDVLEIPFMGSFTATLPRIRRTTFVALKRLKRLKAKHLRKPTDKTKRDLEIQTEYFKRLLALYKLCK